MWLLNIPLQNVIPLNTCRDSGASVIISGFLFFFFRDGATIAGTIGFSGAFFRRDFGGGLEEGIGGILRFTGIGEVGADDECGLCLCNDEEEEEEGGEDDDDGDGDGGDDTGAP